jgi:molybdate transport system permease protein
MNWQAITLTLKLGLCVSTVLLLVGLPIAYWLTFTRIRFKFLVEAVVALPLVLPPTVLGYYVLLSIGPHGWMHHLYGVVTRLDLPIKPFTFEGLVFASVLYSLPFAVQPFAAGFAAVDKRLIEASWTLGASRLRTFFRVILPLSLGSVITGAVLSFAHTLGEFGVVLMVGGNIEGVTRTISIDIYDNVQAFNYAGARETALVLLLFSFVVLSLVYAINRRMSVMMPKW